ncbi:MAG: MFS transporter [Myxococcaceae bacterium]|nr:MFS transporter [Myxococcaceae bacterium]
MSAAAQMPWWREPTKGQWATFAAAWFGWVMDAFDFTVFLLVMPQIAKEFGVSQTATAAIIAPTLLMRLVGGVAAGWAADKWGRKLPLMISVVWFATCNGIMAFAPSFGWILVLRTLFGFGMGAEWTSGATLAMENWPVRSRGIASGILQGSWAIGFLLAGIAFGAIVPTWGWRGLFIVAAAPAILAFPIRFFVPESEEWKAGKAKAEAQKPLSWGAIAKMPGVVKRLAWGSVAMAAGFGGYYALVGNYSPLVQNALGGTIADVTRGTTLFNIGMLIGAVICGAIATRVGVVVAVAVPAALMAVLAPLYVGWQPDLLMVGAFLAGMLGGGYSGVTPLLLTNLFSSAIRARCVGIVYHLGAVPAAFVPMAIAWAAESKLASLPVAMGVMIAVCQLLMAGLIILAPTEAPKQAGEESDGAVALAH